MPEWLGFFFRIINVVEILPHKCQVFCIFYCIIFVFYYFFVLRIVFCLLNQPFLPVLYFFFFTQLGPGGSRLWDTVWRD